MRVADCEAGTTLSPTDDLPDRIKTPTALKAWRELTRTSSPKLGKLRSIPHCIIRGAPFSACCIACHVIRMPVLRHSASPSPTRGNVICAPAGAQQDKIPVLRCIPLTIQLGNR